MDETATGATAPASRYTPEHVAVLEAEHGRVLVVGAGEGAERVEFALKLPDAKEWATIASDAEKGNPDVAELALRRAVVGLGEETKAERARMESALDADPGLSDYFGYGLLVRCGFQAAVSCEPGTDPGTFALSAEVMGETVTIASRKVSRPQYKALRAVLVREGQHALGLAAWATLCGDEASRAAVAARFPALPAAFGAAALEAGSKAKGASPFVR